jgi:predicted ester cyclase
VASPGAAFVTAALPKASTVAAADTSFQENLSRLGLAALIAVALAWVGADVFMARDGESRKQVVAELYRVYETGDLQELDDIVSLDLVDQNPVPGQLQGLSGYKQVVARFRAAFPNGSLEPDDLLADDDKVVARVTLRGTHVSEFYGAEPSGEDVIANGVETFRFANGVIVEMWSMFTPLSIVEHTDHLADESEDESEPDRNLFQRLKAFVTGRKSA